MQFSERYEREGPFNTGAGGGTADYLVSSTEKTARLGMPVVAFRFLLTFFFFQFMMMFLMASLLLTYPLMMMFAPISPGTNLVSSTRIPVTRGCEKGSPTALLFSLSWTQFLVKTLYLLLCTAGVVAFQRRKQVFGESLFLPCTCLLHT